MKQEQERSKGGALFLSLLMGILSGFIISVLMLCLFAALFASRDTPQSVVTPMACISIACGTFAGGFMAARAYRSKGFFTGAVTGLLFFGVLYITGAIMKQIDVGVLAFLKFVVSVLFGCLGGIAGINMRRGRSRA